MTEQKKSELVEILQESLMEIEGKEEQNTPEDFRQLEVRYVCSARGEERELTCIGFVSGKSGCSFRCGERCLR